MTNDILIIIDPQNDFISGSLFNNTAISRIKNIVNLIKEFQGNEIIITQDTHYKNNMYFTDYRNTLEGKNLPIEHCIADTTGWQINREIAVAIDDKKQTGCNIHYIQKSSFGSYENLTDTLEYLIEYKKPNKLIFCGFDTDICVISNILITQAAFPEIPIEIIENCCAGSTNEKHQAALEVLESCQIKITTMEEKNDSV